jgi:hypothetical protein
LTTEPLRVQGFCVWSGLWCWLREGQWDGCAEEFEDAALGGGGLGELVELGGVGDGDAVAGEGAQVGQQGAEGSHGFAVVVVAAGCLAGGGF